jgi:hypothetical protein
VRGGGAERFPRAPAGFFGFFGGKGLTFGGGCGIIWRGIGDTDEIF